MSEKIRDSFIFYRSFFEAVKPLEKEQKADVLEAICAYALDGNLIELQGVSKGFFTLIKPQLDANRRKWTNGCKEKSKPEAKYKQQIIKDEANPKQKISKPEANVNENEECKLVIINVNEKFNIFWENYKPVKTSDGRIVNKGDKKIAQKSFDRQISKHSFDIIFSGLERYLLDCQKNNIPTCQASVFLNQERFLRESTALTISAQNLKPKTAAEEWKEIIEKMDNTNKKIGE
jgi:hypothetical protein